MKLPPRNGLVVVVVVVVVVVLSLLLLPLLLVLLVVLLSLLLLGMGRSKRCYIISDRILHIIGVQNML